VPADCAALYFALHSLIERACAGENDKIPTENAQAASAALKKCFVMIVELLMS
jgi:hypothetical protein